METKTQEAIQSIQDYIDELEGLISDIKGKLDNDDADDYRKICGISQVINWFDQRQRTR